MQILEKMLEKFGTRLGLSRIRNLLREWGNPQNKLKVILVGGTNGKGSTVAYLSSILKETGYKVGSYYSPHLIEYNERIRIDGKEITNKEFAKYQKRIIDYLDSGNEITLFEALTAIAFQYFTEKKCDYAVMETGMGGRLDACNIAEEKIAIVTNVGKDHTEYLGNTEEKIAYEKIGILKKGIGIIGAKGKALGIIKKEAKRRKRKLYILWKDFSIKNTIANEKETIFDYCGKKRYKKIKLAMLGEYQARNATLAIRAAEELGITEKIIRDGLKKTKIKGRLEIIRKNPLVVIDVAHNPHGLKELIKNLKIFGYRKLTIVFGVMKDKDWKKMVQMLDKIADRIILTKPRYSRAEDPNKIGKCLNNGKIIRDSKSALKYAIKTAIEKELILVTGSFYHIGELLRHNALPTSR